MRYLDPPPWPIRESGSAAVVAVLDSGFSQTHPALSEIAIAEARSFTGHNPFDDRVGHGTECCSMLVAHPGPGRTGGIVQDAQLFIGQIIEPSGLGTLEALCASIEWVAGLEADVVAVPSGRLSDHPHLRAALDVLLATGALVIAPVGNPFNGQTGPLYPAAYPGIIGVGSHAYLDTYRTWSQPPDIVVSGHEVQSCTLDGGWRVATDTSHATMLVSGFACHQAAAWRLTHSSRLTRETFLHMLFQRG